MPLPSGAAHVSSLIIAFVALLGSLGAMAVSVMAMRIARRTNQHEIVDRYDSDGPTFEAQPGVVRDHMVDIRLRVVGGPGRMAIEVKADDVPWCSGLSLGFHPMDGSLLFPSLTSGDDITSTAHLTAEPVTGPEQMALPLLLTAESLEDPPRVWRRRVPVPITKPPRSALF